MQLFASKGFFTLLCFVVGLAVFGVAYTVQKHHLQAKDSPVEESGQEEPEDLPSEIFDAVVEDDVNKLRRLLEAGADPNQVGADGRTALHMAITLSEISTTTYGQVQTLLTWGANPNLADADGFTPMHAASLRDDEALMMALLEAGGDPNFSHPDFQTPYVSALSSGNRSTVAAIERWTHERPDNYEQRTAMGVLSKGLQDSLRPGLSAEERQAAIARTIDMVKDKLPISDPEAITQEITEQTEKMLDESGLRELREAQRQR